MHRAPPVTASLELELVVARSASLFVDYRSVAAILKNTFVRGAATTVPRLV
jgi:hypothetical protein